MKISPQWVRDFVDLNVNYHQLAEDLTLAGIAVESVSGEGDETIFEMDITTNRPDAMNHYGVARECSAIYDLPLKPIEPQLPFPPGGDARPPFPIEIQDEQGCARFTARIVRNVTIKPSSEKITRRLQLLDQRPINNAVDATNYTLWEMGKPTHVFDLDLLEGGKIVVRRARDGETLKTLDGVERKLTSEDLVIADAKKPVGMAGTMGGFDTMITEKTRNILIESAWWDPVTVRKMSRRHGLHTDASHRFERGADYESTVLSSDRVAELILQSGGGELGGIVDVIARKLDLAPIALHVSEVQRILGEKLETGEILRILRRLGFELIPEPGDEAEFTVLVPSWRLDIEREIDVIEEIARMHGYDKFPNTLPAYVGAVVEQPDAPKDKKLRTSLLALGYDEAISLTFISHQDAEQFSNVPVIELANPLSEEASVMRTSMVPGMLNMLTHNLNRGSNDIRLFEAGNVFEWAGEKTAEFKRICMGVTGNASLESVHRPPRPLSFFDVKGDMETLLAAFQRTNLEFKPDTAEYYHPGRSARAVMDGEVVAQFGQIHPEVAAGRKLKQEVFVAELYLDRLYNRGLRVVRYEALPRYPAVERDFSFIFDDAVEFVKIEKTVAGLGMSELRSFVPVEIFRGGSIPAGRYSLLLRSTFQSNDRTLREDEVARWSAEIVKALETLGGTLRAS
ncbi:MAG TPA: phenylalanine--tRNA ligase subunit beta [Terriglobales bacterium]|jgi:phenylalanyl-tRNA synthetase beta chain|nr:phenylalanine--tRNA ligase subunit beta [Terriglobales bacterium]